MERGLQVACVQLTGSNVQHPHVLGHCGVCTSSMHDSQHGRECQVYTTRCIMRGLGSWCDRTRTLLWLHKVSLLLLLLPATVAPLLLVAGPVHMLPVLPPKRLKFLPCSLVLPKLCLLRRMCLAPPAEFANAAVSR